MSETPLILEECEPALTEKDMDRLERSLGYPLPASIRAHYLRFNGGYLPEEQMERQRIAFGGFNPIRIWFMNGEELAGVADSFDEFIMVLGRA